MVTTYGALLDIAVADLTIASTRPDTPGNGPTAHTPAAVLDVAGALAHLGKTLGMSPNADARAAPNRQRSQLLATLHAAAKLSAARHPAQHQLTGVDLDLADAASALRTAADLIASRGPRPEDLTARYLNHSDWTAPRPDTLYSTEVLAGAWSQIAGLAHAAAVVARRTDHPELHAAAQNWARAATRVPLAPADLALELAQPGWPLPLPYRDIPGEWDGRMQELSALAWRVGNIHTPRTAAPHPIGALRGIAEIAHVIHTRAAQAAEHPRDAAQHKARADVWHRISICTHCLHTPADPLTPERRWALARTRELAYTADLDHADLLTGRAVGALSARQLAAGLARNYEQHPGVLVGPSVRAPELRRNPGIALAALHKRAAGVPKGGLKGLVELLGEAGTSSNRPCPPDRAPLRRPAIATIGSLGEGATPDSCHSVRLGEVTVL